LEREKKEGQAREKEALKEKGAAEERERAANEELAELKKKN